MMITWSARRSASASSWVVRITQIPRSRWVAMMDRTAMRPSGSTPAVGSSRKSTSGLSDQRQSQRQALLFASGQPPPRGRPDIGPGRPDRAACRGPRGRRSTARRGGGPGPTRASDRRRRCCSITPMRGTRAAWSETGSRPRTRIEPLVDRPVALEGLDRARLAGAVRAEQGDDLTRAPGEGQPVDGQGVAVADDHVLADHRRRWCRIGRVVHGGSRYRCLRHDRYPQGERRPRIGEGRPGPPRGGPGRGRPARRARREGALGHRSAGRAPGSGQSPLQTGRGSPSGRRRPPPRTS